MLVGHDEAGHGTSIGLDYLGAAIESHARSRHGKNGGGEIGGTAENY